MSKRLSEGGREMAERRRKDGRIQHRKKVFDMGGRKRVTRHSVGADYFYAPVDNGEVIPVNPIWKQQGRVAILDEHRLVCTFDPRTLTLAVESRETGATMTHRITHVRGEAVERDNQRRLVIEPIRANGGTPAGRVRVNDIVPGVDYWIAFIGGPDPHMQFDALPAEYTWETSAEGTWFANGDLEGRDNSAGEPSERRLMETERTVELDEPGRMVVTERCTGRVRTRDAQRRYRWTTDPVGPIRMH